MKKKDPDDKTLFAVRINRTWAREIRQLALLLLVLALFFVGFAVVQYWACQAIDRAMTLRQCFSGRSVTAKIPLPKK